MHVVTVAIVFLGGKSNKLYLFVAAAILSHCSHYTTFVSENFEQILQHLIEAASSSF
jgi:hypothetical protein